MKIHKSAKLCSIILSRIYVNDEPFQSDIALAGWDEPFRVCELKFEALTTPVHLPFYVFTKVFFLRRECASEVPCSLNWVYFCAPRQRYVSIASKLLAPSIPSIFSCTRTSLSVCCMCTVVRTIQNIICVLLVTVCSDVFLLSTAIQAILIKC